MKTIHTLPTGKPKQTNPDFGKLPDESAFELISGLFERAQKCGQPFKLAHLDRIKHPRGYCIGQTSSEFQISVFYLSEYGDYAWAENCKLCVVPEVSQSRTWTQKPIQIGMLYWFQQASPLASPEIIKAVPVGTVGPLASAYIALNPEPAEEPPKTRKKNKSESGEMMSYIHPPPPKRTEKDFLPLQSLDELGL